MSETILAIIMKLTLAMNANASASATLLFAGDAMMHKAQIDAAQTPTGNYDFSDCFTPLKPIIERADYAVVNLETPLGYSNYTGYPAFNAPVSYAGALKDSGFDLFLTANNHALDRRDKGLKNTIAALDTLRVDHIGTYLNSSNRNKALPFIKDLKGFKIGFLNYTYGTNGITVQGDAIVDYIDRKQIAIDVDITRKAGAELIVAAMHWGDEYVLIPNKSQRDLADYLISLGVEIIIGGHPHVVQPLELRKNPETGRNTLVTYSLGNFISNMKTRDTRGGTLAEVKISRDSIGKATVSDARYHHVFTVPPTYKNDNFKVYPIDSVPDNWKNAANAFRNALK